MSSNDRLAELHNKLKAFEYDQGYIQAEIEQKEHELYELEKQDEELTREIDRLEAEIERLETDW